ncbi:MAG: pyridoxal phosphate-dependent aminotransferase family protein [Salinimicrobium sp.]
MRKQQNAFRQTGSKNAIFDFSSNDYLGFSRNEKIFERSKEVIEQKQLFLNGATGSRLLSGNHELYAPAEEKIAAFHQTEAALIFNSGYDANLGLFGSVPQRGDLIFYDELVHASIRDGISISHAKAYKYRHNDLKDLEQKIRRFAENSENADVYVVTEAVFSMDGDTPDLVALIDLSKKLNFFLILDEAHSLGVLGENGKGAFENSGLKNDIFARLFTFGKALGAHGAAVVGSVELKDYLVNFARSFIYTTALPPHSVATIAAAYEYLEEEAASEVEELKQNISFFKEKLQELELSKRFIPSNSAIQCCIIPGNEQVKQLSAVLQKNGFDVKPILSPTVAAGKERLRFCLHSFNTRSEIQSALSLLSANL